MPNTGTDFTRDDGRQYQRSGLAFATKATRSVYLKSKPAFLIHNNGKGPTGWKVIKTR